MKKKMTESQLNKIVKESVRKVLKENENEWLVTCTKIYNGEVVVQASSEEEAEEMAREAIDNGQVNWQLGEATVDYVEPYSTLPRQNRLTFPKRR